MSDQTSLAPPSPLVQVGVVDKIAKALNSGKAWLLYMTVVVGAVVVLYGHWQNAGFPVPVFKHQMDDLLAAFGKEKIDPLGITTKQALDKINELKIDLTAANGRNEALQIQIVNLNDNVKRLVTITDRLLDRLARASISSSAPIPTTTPLAGDVR